MFGTRPTTSTLKVDGSRPERLWNGYMVEDTRSWVNSRSNTILFHQFTALEIQNLLCTGQETVESQMKDIQDYLRQMDKAPKFFEILRRLCGTPSTSRLPKSETTAPLTNKDVPSMEQDSTKVPDCLDERSATWKAAGILLAIYIIGRCTGSQIKPQYLYSRLNFPFEN